ncbi:aminotransferase, class I and II [Alkaliphilus metalliredigens QYMF]|uniref:Aminotransferase n=1 Tax=Alkaliphilus metalliredigens (strain QYMF) TaxID=293826 RepID=A6TRI7_ALKMQ|nr:pyridoxal phosphate-dependent aminotransferase [Alkaliphilus metalliredigens]ABR48805.1 aminotransferase, class I and II [Alkaliphilus metalliredigens QYMF]
MKVELSKKGLSVSSSITLAIDSKAKQMKAEGMNVISFGVGEPDFQTPDYIKQAAIKAIEEKSIGYTPAPGMLQLRQSICNKLASDNELEYLPQHIIVSNGAKHSVYNIFQAVCNPGDEVIIPVPYWVSYPEHVKMADAIPVYIDCPEENDFKMKPEDFLAAISSKTKAIILNSPSNPTGAVYSKKELEQIAKIAVDHNILVVSDEIYEKLIYGNEKHVSIASLNSEIKDLTIVINGMSKGYAMTGWRIGYTASNSEIAKIMSNIQSHATSNPNTVAQYASIEALERDQSSIETMRLAFDERRKYMINRVNEIQNLSCIAPNGAFYIMMNISQLIGKVVDGKIINGSMDFAEVLLDRTHVAVVPGIAFGVDHLVRLSYANSMENITEGLNRIDKFLNE